MLLRKNWKIFLYYYFSVPFFLLFNSLENKWNCCWGNNIKLCMTAILNLFHYIKLFLRFSEIAIFYPRWKIFFINWAGIFYEPLHGKKHSDFEWYTYFNFTKESGKSCSCQSFSSTVADFLHENFSIVPQPTDLIQNSIIRTVQRGLN